MAAETTDEIRSAIDSGRTGGKVEGSDPAAAPLGSDTEAAGRPATQQQLDIASENEAESPGRAHPKRNRTRVGHAWVLFGAAIIIGAVILAAIVLRGVG
jgi:hypothetical protein